MRQDALQQDSGGDPVDAIVEQWRRERPEADTSAKQVTGRIVRLAGLIQGAFAEAFLPLGITEAEFGVLAPLRRAGAPFELTPTELARQKMMTSGGMTAAIDRLARKRLVERLPNPSDRRGSLVRLTDAGVEVIEEAMTMHTEVEHRMVAGLSATQRAQLEKGLRALLRAVER